jgi:hypothetical protein
LAHHITILGYAEALGISYPRAAARLRGLHSDERGERAVRRIELADALLTVRAKEWGFLPVLFSMATDEPGPLFVGDNVLPRCRALIAWLDSAQRDRLFRVQVDFTNALALGLRSSALFEHLDALRLKLILAPEILRFVVIGDDSKLPNFEGGWAVSFAITNARFEPIFTQTEEAA